jgi:hypothetical protein
MVWSYVEHSHTTTDVGTKEDLMRYLMAVIDTHSNSGNPDEMRAIDAFNERLQSNGQWVMAAGVMGPDHSIVVDNRGSEPLVTNGPLHQVSEYMSGFWIVEVADHETAVRLATDGSRACNRKVELRPFIER